MARKEVVKANFYQRIDVWLVAVDRQQRGRVEPQNNMVQLYDIKQSGEQDLLGSTAIDPL
ncbi:MAG TPA: hypothetical protein V6C95_12790 [Coleofasciculaceae cyanobacterium]